MAIADLTLFTGCLPTSGLLNTCLVLYARSEQSKADDVSGSYKRIAVDQEQIKKESEFIKRSEYVLFGFLAFSS